MATSSYDPVGSRIAAQNGAGTSQKSMLLEPTNPSRLVHGRRLILSAPGHGGDASSYQQGITGTQQYLGPLADAGYTVLGVDAGGPSSWGNAASVTALDDAVNWAVGEYGVRARVAFATYSMGGLSMLNWMRRHAASIAGGFMFAPASDVSYFGSASYSPAYSVPSGAAPGGYAADVAAAYPSGHVGYSPHEDYASFRGLGVPVRIRHATDDTTVPYAMTTSLLTLIGDSDYEVAKPDITGGHTGLFTSVPVAEVVAFFDSLQW